MRVGAVVVGGGGGGGTKSDNDDDDDRGRARDGRCDPCHRRRCDRLCDDDDDCHRDHGHDEDKDEV